MFVIWLEQNYLSTYQNHILRKPSTYILVKFDSKNVVHVSNTSRVVLRLKFQTEGGAPRVLLHNV